MRAYTLFIAILTYAFFSSPTPDRFGWAEMAVFGLLLFAIYPVKMISTITQNALPAPLNFHRLFLFFMVSVPLIIGAMNGYPMTDIMRDLIPLICLILPFCFLEKNMKWFPLVLMIAGCVFAIRYIIDAVPHLVSLGTEAGNESLLYLANSPLLLFACLYGFHKFTEPQKIFWTERLIGLLVVGVTLVAMTLMVQRAPMVLSVLGCITILIFRFGTTPIKLSIITALLCFLIMPFYGVIIEVADGFWEKTLTVGLNNRTEEFTHVAKQASMFGAGWGSVWQSPAVSDYWVRYTHNMVSYYLLKSGIIGATLAIIFMCVWLWQSIRIARHHFAMGVALFMPLLIHMTLYTGYKTFDFALLILLIFIWNRDHQASLSSTALSRPDLARRGGLRPSSQTI